MSLGCLVGIRVFCEAHLGIPQGPPIWPFLAVVLHPMAHTAWVARRPESDSDWVRLSKSCGIAVAICLIPDVAWALQRADPAGAAARVLENAIQLGVSLLLPRFALRALAPGIFSEEASIPGFRNRRGRQFLAQSFVGVLLLSGLVVTVIPNFMTFALRAKSGEVRAQIAAIRDAEEQWFAEHGRYLATSPVPPGKPGVNRTPVAMQDLEAAGFDRLRWLGNLPTGLYCSYAVRVDEAEGDAFTIEAVCDLDGDGDLMAFGWIKPAPGKVVGVPGYFGYCSVRGVLTRRGATDGRRVLDRFGPCDSSSTVSHF